MSNAAVMLCVCVCVYVCVCIRHEIRAGTQDPVQSVAKIWKCYVTASNCGQGTSQTATISLLYVYNDILFVYYSSDVQLFMIVGD